MDGKWTLPILPTAYAADDKGAMDKFIEIFPELKKTRDNEFIAEQVRGLTTQLVHRHPYNPATWTSRAYNLLRLGYPDLAIGDTFKALMLLDMWLSPSSKLRPAIDKELWREIKQNPSSRFTGPNAADDRLSRMMAYSERLKDRAILHLAQALFVANCFVECFEVLKGCSPKSRHDKFKKLKELAEHAQMMEDLSRLQENDFVRTNDPVSQETQKSGSIVSQIYPWSAPFVQRGDAISSTASSNVAKASNDKCSLSHSSITDEVASTNLVEKAAGTLGIVANVDFNTGALLFIDRTFLSGVNDSQNCCNCCRGLFDQLDFTAQEAICCDTPFCGDKCIELALKYHYAVCGKLQDLDQLPQLHLDRDNISADARASNSLLFRLLAHIEAKPAIHPLRTPTVGAMIPAYRNTDPISFSLLNDIKRPFLMLFLLGVDIFKDHALDTWVIQTIQARLRNNVREYTDESGRYHISVNLTYMFLNHSCDPNVEIVPHWSGSSQIHAVASRSIKQGEELFITYLDSKQLDLPYAERQELLKDWTGGQCQCQRCHQERAEIDSGARGLV